MPCACGKERSNYLTRILHLALRDGVHVLRKAEGTRVDDGIASQKMPEATKLARHALKCGGSDASPVVGGLATWRASGHGRCRRLHRSRPFSRSNFAPAQYFSLAGGEDSLPVNPTWLSSISCMVCALVRWIPSIHLVLQGTAHALFFAGRYEQWLRTTIAAAGRRPQWGAAAPTGNWALR